MSEVWQALRMDGIETTYGQFRTYAWRIRKRLGSRQEEQHRYETETEQKSGLSPDPASNSNPVGDAPGLDPLANIRREQNRKRTSGFNYNATLGDVE